MEEEDIGAEDEGGASEGASVGRRTPATAVEGADTGLSTAGDEVTQLHP